MKSEGPRVLCGRCKGVPNPSITLLTAGRMHNPAMCGMRACTALGTTRGETSSYRSHSGVRRSGDLLSIDRAVVLTRTIQNVALHFRQQAFFAVQH